MFGISTNHIRSIDTYDEAKRRYESIKPIRGNLLDIRPLGKRRAHHMRIQKNAVDGMEVYECVLYSTACVTWYPDGKVLLRDNGWATPSTAKFIDSVMAGVWASCTAKHICVRVNSKDYPVPKNGLWLQHNGITWAVLNPPKVYVTVLNRTEARCIRTLAKPILDYFKVMAPLMEDTGISFAEIQAAAQRLTQQAGGQRSFHAKESFIGWALRQEKLDIEVLADLMFVCRGRITLGDLYAGAITGRVTDSNALYDKRYLESGVVKRGMKLETEQT